MSINTALLLSSTQQGSSTSSLLFSLLPIVLLFVLMWFIMIRPQKKKEKETQNMRKSVQIGDEITTIGGIVGIIVKKSDDTIVIETGGDRSKLRVKLWAIQSCETVHDATEE